MAGGKILAHKKVGATWKFLTTWEGFPESEATWEPIGHFSIGMQPPLWII